MYTSRICRACLLLLTAVLLIVSGSTAKPPARHSYPSTTSWWTGHNTHLDQYYLAPGYPQEYLVTFIASPRDPHAHRFTVTDTAGEIGSEHAMNDRGVTVSGYAGGFARIAEPTPASSFSGYHRPGLDWQVGDFYAAAFGESARVQ